MNRDEANQFLKLGTCSQCVWMDLDDEIRFYNYKGKPTAFGHCLHDDTGRPILDPGCKWYQRRPSMQQLNEEAGQQ